MGTPIAIHRRTYTCEAWDEGDGTMRVRGRLTDNKPNGLGVVDGEPLVIHDMVVDLLVRLADFEIVAVDTGMDTHPYPLCTEVLAAYEQLVGVSIARGYNRKIKELFGGRHGCSHLGALLQALGPVAVQASWSAHQLNEPVETRLESTDDEVERERRVRLNANTCHVWADDGAPMRAMTVGLPTIRPQWEIDRLRKLGVEVEDNPPIDELIPHEAPSEHPGEHR
ncbi:MAG: DUF2889 domain-containing protein [Actinomycetia bacterium]|nr:DUF2889 domain-containing protein [Actinomycetes bacterium]